MGTSTDDGTILVVDDNPTNLRLLLDTLQDSGYRTLIATTGERALQQIQRMTPDLILLDIMMPGADGFETCRRLKEAPAMRDIPVIFMTALTKSADKVRGFEAGAVDYITKPFQQEEVLSRVRTHLTLRRQHRELEVANATKDRFFSIVAHDMRGAFNSLFAYADLLADQLAEAPDGMLRKTSDNLNRCVEGTYRLLENLLQWAQVQQGKMPFEPRSVKLHYLLADILVLTRGHWEKKGIIAENTIPEDRAAWADERMLHTVFRNLVTNAIKFTPTGGRIVLGAEEGRQEHRISVADSGVGISEEHLEKLFRIDAKHQEAGTDGETGTGLGLVLCRELVKKNGGEIGITSRSGEGTVVTVTLPKFEHSAGGSLTREGEEGAEILNPGT